MRVLLAIDFDGAAQIHPLVERFLASCAELPSIDVAILSARDSDDVRRRIGGVQAIIAGDVLRGGGKRAALRTIAQRVGAGHVVYAGGDLPALEYAARCGRAIFMDRDGRDAPPIAQLRHAANVEALCYGFARELIDVVPEAIPGLLAYRTPARTSSTCAARTIVAPAVSDGSS
jgi:3-deoxy-D-manno-octulosonate 8-phosphate phosphatase KdsC-like HAD superfamily phosphatase